jgi:hypothetical protein
MRNKLTVSEPDTEARQEIAELAESQDIDYLLCYQGETRWAGSMPLRFLPFILRVRISIISFSALIQVPNGRKF